MGGLKAFSPYLDRQWDGVKFSTWSAAQRSSVKWHQRCCSVKTPTIKLEQNKIICALDFHLWFFFFCLLVQMFLEENNVQQLQQSGITTLLTDFITGCTFRSIQGFRHSHLVCFDDSVNRERTVVVDDFNVRPPVVYYTFYSTKLCNVHFYADNTILYVTGLIKIGETANLAPGNKGYKKHLQAPQSSLIMLSHICLIRTKNKM